MKCLYGRVVKKISNVYFSYRDNLFYNIQSTSNIRYINSSTREYTNMFIFQNFENSCDSLLESDLSGVTFNAMCGLKNTINYFVR